MDIRTYNRMTEKQLVGCRVRALHEIKSGVMAIPEGAILEIRGKRSGLSLASPKCDHCGVRVFIRKVNPHSVELVPE